MSKSDRPKEECGKLTKCTSAPWGEANRGQNNSLSDVGLWVWRCDGMGVVAMSRYSHQGVCLV